MPSFQDNLSSEHSLNQTNKVKANASAFKIENIVDLNQYPITTPDSEKLRSVIAKVRCDLELEGCARLSSFINQEASQLLQSETDSLEHLALFSVDEYTPYGGLDDRFPADHPRNITHRTTSGNVTKDLIPTEMLIQQLYADKTFQAFIASCLDVDTIYEFADPMRGLIINAMPNGTTLGWHYDANEFIVSMMTRRSEGGGTFEYCPNIRNPGDENYGAVKSVLTGDRQLVKSLDLQVGDIQIFKGRYSLHRVAPVEGIRHTVIFGYAKEPGFIGNAESTRRIYGRCMQQHIDADLARQKNADGLAD